MPELGDHVRDVVSGLEGVVLAKLDALYEASQCRVHPTDLKSDGEVRTGVWFEDGRLKVIDDKGPRLTGFASINHKK